MRTGTKLSPVPAAELAQPVVRASFLSLTLLCIGHFFIDLYSSALGAFQPVLVERLGLSLSQAGIVGGVLVFSSSVMQPLYGYLSDRFHTKVFTALAPALAGVFIAALNLAPNYGVLLLMVALGGAGIASFHPQGTAWATRGLELNRARWMAVFISSGTLGYACGPASFSIIMIKLGRDGAIWGALPGIAATVALLLFLPLGTPPAQDRRHVNWSDLRAVWRPMTILYFLVFIRSIIQITFAQMLPLYLHRARGFELSKANYALSLYLACGAIGGFAGGHLADRFGGRRVIQLSMIGCLPFLGLFFFTDGWTALAGLGLAGLVLLFTIPVNVLMAQELAPGQAGTVSALMMGFAWGMAGMIFIPLTGWASDMFSMHSVFSALMIFPAIGFLLALKLPK